MPRFEFLALLALTVVHCYGALQVQMPETAELQQPDDDVQSQIKDLQRNVSDIWTYIYELRNAVSGHLNHLRQHQVELESSMHKMEHLHENELHSSGSHHHSGEHHSHSGEQHSHSGEQHSHGGDHSHSGDHSHGSDHSHSSDHSHGSDHSHSSEHHSHSGEHHSHSDEHHSHSGEHGHSSHSHSHSHTSHDHSMEDGSHSHGDDHQHHKDSHETEDLQQQTQQVAGPPPVVEPVVAATTRQGHSHHHHHRSQTSRSGDADSLNLMNENNFHHHHHHHHHDSGRGRRNRTVELPKYSDYGLYDLALCDVTPNRAIPEDQQQNVVGTVTLWQKKTGGPLNLHVRLQGFNVDDHHGHHGQSVQHEQDNETPQVVGHKHGFHVHASGDLSNGCQSTGGHYDPKGVNHGGPNSLVRHVGDLGSIECDEHGITNIVFSDDIASLRGPYSIIGKAIVIHALEDDLGLGGDEGSLKTGNAGSRLACCVIRRVDKIPIRQHKAMKSATQYQNR